jgi:hypothetical protein
VNSEDDILSVYTWDKILSVNSGDDILSVYTREHRQ